MKKFEKKLIEIAKLIVDNEKARMIVEPYKREKGYWFGGGKIRKDREGRLVITGRYRNFGDSRYGVGLGERGLELAIFVSEDKGKTFKKIKSFTKKDIRVGEKDVLSIEGSSIYFGEKVELYVSSEKKRKYPTGFEKYQKEQTGVWEIDVVIGESLENLSSENIKNIIISENPEIYMLKTQFYLI